MQGWDANKRQERLREWIEHAASDLPQTALQTPELITALAHMRTGEPVSTEQTDSLVANIVLHMRPAVPVRDDAIFFDPPWSHLVHAPAQDHLKAACGAVGQLESSGTEVAAYVGTAFLVSPDLIVTTRHVAELFATGIGVREISFRPGRQLHIDFANGGDKDTLQAYPVSAVTMIHPYLDIAILRLSVPTPIAPLNLWAQDPGALEGRDIAVIAYPQFDRRYGVELQKTLLTAELGVKRVMPGKVIKPRLRSALGTHLLALTHDAITLGGSSGGPVLDLQTGLIVGVSFASSYLDANFAVPISEMAQDPYMWDAGLQFVGASKPSISPWHDYWREANPSDASAVLTQTVATPTSVPSVRSTVELLVAEHFSDASRFRHFLTEHGHHEVVRAVPESADSMELVRALDRRGLLDEAFLQALTAAVPGAPAGPALVSPWL